MTINIPPGAAAASPWPAWRPATDPEVAAAEAARRDRGLRRHGAVRAIVGLAVAALLALWKPLFAAVVAAVALVLLLVALVAPHLYARVAAGLERFGHGVGTGLTWLLMPLLYVLLFLPVGLVLRARGKLRVTFGPDPKRATYWEVPPPEQRWGGSDVASYRRQF